VVAISSRIGPDQEIVVVGAAGCVLAGRLAANLHRFGT
jgi:hypothetical protein